MNFIKRIRDDWVLDKLKKTWYRSNGAIENLYLYQSWRKGRLPSFSLALLRDGPWISSIKKISYGWFLEMQVILRPWGWSSYFVIMCDKLNNATVDGYTDWGRSWANLIEATESLCVIAWRVLSLLVESCSVGGAVFMNAGAYGGEIALISCNRVRVLTKDGEIGDFYLPKT